VQRSDLNAEDGVHSWGFKAVGGNFHSVVVNLLDTRDVRNTLAAHAFILGAPETDKRGAGIAKNIGTSNGLVGECRGDIIAVGSHELGVVVVHGREGGGQVPIGAGASAAEDHGVSTVLWSNRFSAFSNRGGALEGAKAPHAHGIGHIRAGGLDFLSGLAVEIFSGVLIGAVAGPDFVINTLNFSLDGFNKLRPDICLLFFSPGVGGSPDMVGAGSVDLIKERQVLVVNFAGGLGLVVFQTNNVVGGQRGGTDIRGIQEGVVGEDDVICGDGFAIGEFHPHAEAGGVFGGIGSFIVFHFYVRGAFVQVVNAVIRHCFAFNRVEDDTALAVGGQQGDLGHRCDIGVIGCIGIERAEFLRELAVSNHKGGRNRGSGGQILTERLFFENNSGLFRRSDFGWSLSHYRSFCWSFGSWSRRASGDRHTQHHENQQIRKELCEFGHFFLLFSPSLNRDPLDYSVFKNIRQSNRPDFHIINQ